MPSFSTGGRRVVFGVSLSVFPQDLGEMLPSLPSASDQVHFVLGTLVSSTSSLPPAGTSLMTDSWFPCEAALLEDSVIWVEQTHSQ